jgi:hypothetical protein
MRSSSVSFAKTQHPPRFPSEHIVCPASVPELGDTSGSPGRGANRHEVFIRSYIAHRYSRRHRNGAHDAAAYDGRGMRFVILPQR